MTSPVTIEWEACTDPAAQVIWVWWDNETTGEEFDKMFPVEATGFEGLVDLSNGDYEIGLGYEVWYEDRNSDGIQVYVGKYSESDYEFTVEDTTESKN